MAARKLQQEVDKCFKKVAEGVTEFSAIYEKIEQSNNPAQKDKLEDNLKREIKKLQRLRDQIKTWAASNDIKDKAPLLEHRKLIETQMEKFKAVEKAMKTKAYSKEGLSAAAKLDPKEQAKVEASEFLSSMVDDLEQQIETLEAEGESIQATMKKGKNNSAKAERIAEVERVIERHKWHQGKLELIRRSLENGGVEPEQVNDLEESIRYYVSDGMNEDFIEDEEMYEELDLEDEEGTYGMGLDNEKNSSLDTQSEGAEGGRLSAEDILPDKVAVTCSRYPPCSSNNNQQRQRRRPTDETSISTYTAGRGGPQVRISSCGGRRERQEQRGYCPVTSAPGAASSSISPLPQSRTSATNSPATSLIQPASQQAESKQSTPAITAAEPEPVPVPVPVKPSKRSKAAGKQPAVPEATESPKPPQTNGASNGVKRIEEAEEECIYHLPSSLQDLVDTYETSRKRPAPPSAPSTLRIMTSSQGTCPDVQDADVPRSYRPDVPVPPTVSGFPREPLAIFEDPRLYSKIDPDTLFYVFYYKQGSPQQYLAAKALKDQSWRFHKQYQTWFQRHEEPKNITEDFEQGTYRFFDYESTWMNRRKADFKFAYKFLEDEV
ncbi:general negative regulator of transcription subunit 5 [Fusarium falciforme]|nr:general negative regulator of transcription subunit 5 [Fusarium falciforme]